MSTIIFGGTVSLISSATPSAGGYLIGYDTDGVLKQKDSLGNISPIGGLTAGGIGTSSLSDVLAIGNNSGSYNIVMGTSSSIKSSNGNSEIKLDDSGNPHRIKITTNNGSGNYSNFDLIPNLSRLEQTDSTTFSRVDFTNGSVNFVTGQLLSKYTTLDISTDVFNLQFNDSSLLQGQISIIESGTTYDSGSLNKAYLHLNTYNSNTQNGVQNSVVVGGSGITASESDSVYVPQLIIQDSKVIKGSTGSGLIQFTEWNDVMIVSTSQNSIIGILSSSSSSPYFTNTNGIFLVDSYTSSTTPNIPSSNTYLSTQNSNISDGVENTVLIGGIGLNGTQSNTVYLGNNVNINNAFTLPNSDGVSGQVLKTDGSGNITWQNETVTSATQSLYQVLIEGNDTITEDIIMGTSTAIRSGNIGGSVFLDYSGVGGDVIISTDGGNLLTAFVELSGNDITLNSSSGQFNFNSFDTSIITGSNEGLKYAFDYTATFVTYSLVSKGYVDAVSIVSLSASNGLTSSFISGNLSLSTEVDSNSIEINGSNQISLKSTIAGNRQFDDSVTILGDLTVLGTSSYIYTENLFVEDNIITLNGTYSGPAVIDAGIEVNLGDGTYSKILWNSGLGFWQVGLSGSESTILTEVDNGLSKIDNKVVLGGTLSNNTNINIDNYEFSIISNSSNTIKILSDSTGNTHSLDIRPSGGYLRSETVGGDILSLSTTDSTVGAQALVGVTLSSILIYNNDQFLSGSDGSSNNRMVVRDDFYSKGLVYYDDYSSNFTTQSLVTKAYVDSVVGVSGSSGSSGSSGTSGSSGSSGVSGSSGSSGTSGTSGSSGTSGVSGIGATPSLGQVLAVGNTSSGYNIEISQGNYLLYQGITYSIRLTIDPINLTQTRTIQLPPNNNGTIPLIESVGSGGTTGYYLKWNSNYIVSTMSILYETNNTLYVGTTQSFLDTLGRNQKLSIYNYSSATNSITGLFLDVGNSSFSNNGISTNIIDTTGSNSNFAAYNNIDTNGGQKTYGVYNNIVGTNSNDAYGVYNVINLESSDNVYGVFNQIAGGSVSAYGVNSVLQYPANIKYGYYSDVTGAGTSYKNYGSYFLTSGATDSNIGVYSEIGGAFGINNYGIYVRVTNSGTANNGIYVDGLSSNNSIVTKRGHVVFNNDGSTSDFTVKSQNNSEIFYVSGTNNNIGIGTASPLLSTILDVYSTTKAMRIPTLIGDVASALTPANGMLVCITAGGGSFSQAGFYGYVNSNWIQLGP